jgi:hypothetical protein
MYRIFVVLKVVGNICKLRKMFFMKKKAKFILFIIFMIRILAKSLKNKNSILRADLAIDEKLKPEGNGLTKYSRFRCCGSEN